MRKPALFYTDSYRTEMKRSLGEALDEAFRDIEERATGGPTDEEMDAMIRVSMEHVIGQILERPITTEDIEEAQGLVRRAPLWYDGYRSLESQADLDRGHRWGH